MQKARHDREVPHYFSDLAGLLPILSKPLQYSLLNYRKSVFNSKVLRLKLYPNYFGYTTNIYFESIR